MKQKKRRPFTSKALFLFVLSPILRVVLWLRKIRWLLPVPVPVGQDSCASHPWELSEPKSKWATFQGVRLHYETVEPQSSRTGQSSGNLKVSSKDVWLPAMASSATSQSIPFLNGQGEGAFESYKRTGETKTSSMIFEASHDSQNGHQRPPLQSKRSKNSSPSGMILFHGFLSSSFTFRKVMRPLAEVLQTEVLAFDRPGFGYSARAEMPDLYDMSLRGATDSSILTRNPYTSTFSAHAASTFISHLGSKKVVLVGHSAGSVVAIDTYFNDPGRIAAIVLVAPCIATFLANGQPWKRPKLSAREELESRRKDTQNPFQLLARPWPKLGKVSTNQPEFHVSEEEYQHDISFLIQDSRSLKFYSSSALASDAIFLDEDWPAPASLDKASSRERSFYNRFIGWLECARKCLARWLSMAACWLMHMPSGADVVRTLFYSIGAQILRFGWHDPDSEACWEFLRGIYRTISCRGWERSLANFLATCFMAVTRGTEDLVFAGNGLHKLSCPVLVVSGDSDWLVPLWNSKRVAASIPGAKVAVIRNCGHVPHEEQPEEFMEVVQRFLREI